MSGSENASPDGIIGCYRETAERMAVERLVLAGIDNLEAEAESSVDDYETLKWRTLIVPFVNRLADDIVIDDEITEHYEKNRDRYRLKASRTLWNIFRRHRDPARPEETLAFLADLKKRIESGEDFGGLAREYSHSETRLKDGKVGNIEEGRLPEELERVVSALKHGELSEPIRVAQGAVLLRVTEPIAGVDLDREDARTRIENELRPEKLERLIAETAADQALPGDAIVLEGREALRAVVDEENKDKVILEIGPFTRTAGALRAQAGLKPGVELDEETEKRILDVYGQWRDLALVFLKLGSSGSPDHAHIRREAEDALRRLCLTRVTDRRLLEAARRTAAADAESLKRFYDENRVHFQSPPRFKLHIMDVPFGDDPPRQLKQLEDLRVDLVQGKIDFNEAAKRAGGVITSPGWVKPGEIPADVPGKGKIYLMAAGAGGYSVPYQQNQALHMLWIEERLDPTQLRYEETGEDVLDRYFKRSRQTLVREEVEKRLASAGFVFRKEIVEKSLGM